MVETYPTLRIYLIIKHLDVNNVGCRVSAAVGMLFPKGFKSAKYVGSDEMGRQCESIFRHHDEADGGGGMTANARPLYQP